MQTFQAFELPALIELLSEQTELYTKMLSAGYKNADGFKTCQLIIEQLQSEIESRKQFGDTTVSENNISFTE